MYVCMYVCIYLSTYIHLCIYLSIYILNCYNIYIYTYTYIYLYIYIHMYFYIYTTIERERGTRDERAAAEMSRRVMSFSCMCSVRSDIGTWCENRFVMSR